MANRFGDDFILNDDYDIMLNNSDDVMTTMDYERTKKNVPFEGYVAITRAAFTRLTTDVGEYQFDPIFGGRLSDAISKNIDANYINRVKSIVAEELVKDDRIQSVASVDVKVVGGNMVVISARVILIGDDKASELTFPEIVIP